MRFYALEVVRLESFEVIAVNGVTGDAQAMVREIKAGCGFDAATGGRRGRVEAPSKGPGPGLAS